MCMEDVRLGRQTGPAGSFFNIGNGTNDTIAQQNPLRTTLIIACPNAVGCFVAPMPLDPSADQGIFLDRTSDPLILDIQHHGTLVTSQWRADGNAAASTLTVLESILEKQ